MQTKKRLLLVAPEPRYGEGAEIADAILMATNELDNNPYEGDRQTRNRQKQTFGATSEINVAPYTTLTATVPLAGSGTPGEPPAFGLLLRACALAEIIEEAKSVTYRPSTDEHESVCLWFVEDGQVQMIPGVRGTVDFNLTAKQDPTQQYTFTGLYKRPVAMTEALAQRVTKLAEEIPVNYQNTPGRNVHGYQGALESLSVSLGNEVVPRNKPGREDVVITDRNVTGQVDIEAPQLAVKDYFQAVESHQKVTRDVVSIKHGIQAGNIVAIEGTKVQLSTLTRSDNSGTGHYQFNTIYTEDAGDDEIAIIFT